MGDNANILTNPHSHSSNHKPSPVRKKFWTPGVIVMVVLMIAGAAAVIVRFTFGIGSVSHLSTARPWGLWVGVDVATGVALAAGGFTTAAVAHILGRHHYEPVTRPALLTAMLGYTFVVLGLLIDIGRSWAIWKPIFNWNTNSALFEVAMCVAIYLHVLYIEFIPIVAEQYKENVNLPAPLSFLNPVIKSLLQLADNILDKVMWVFVIAGVVLSCMHQSSLGTLMLVAPTKIHPLWYTPILPLLFLTSAFAVGYPMVVFETTLVTSSLKLDDEMEVLTPLIKITVFLLGIYMFLKLGDMVVRQTWRYLFDGTFQTNSFLVEMIIGVVAPWFMLLSKKIRSSRRGIFIAACMIVGGVVLNRVNVFIVAYTPPVSGGTYFPAVGEILVTTGLIAALMFIYRFVVTYLPVLSLPKEVSS